MNWHVKTQNIILIKNLIIMTAQELFEFFISFQYPLQTKDNKHDFYIDEILIPILL